MEAPRTARTFPEKSSFATSAAAVFMEYLRTVSLNSELKEAQLGVENDEIWELRRLKSCLERGLKLVDTGTYLSLMRLYEKRGRGWKCVPVQESRWNTKESRGWPETIRLTVHGTFWSTVPEEIFDWPDVDAKDIHDWTPLHDAAVDGGERLVSEMLEKTRGCQRPRS